MILVRVYHRNYAMPLQAVCEDKEHAKELVKTWAKEIFPNGVITSTYAVEMTDYKGNFFQD